MQHRIVLSEEVHLPLFRALWYVKTKAAYLLVWADVDFNFAFTTETTTRKVLKFTIDHKAIDYSKIVSLVSSSSTSDEQVESVSLSWVEVLAWVSVC